MQTYRTHTCGELRKEDIGKKVKLAGWIQRKRNLGNLCFVDLRDHYGITQCVFDSSSDLFAKIEAIRPESVIGIDGEVVLRESINKNMPTGDIEIKVTGLVLHSAAEVLPFQIAVEDDAPEEIRLNAIAQINESTPVGQTGGTQPRAQLLHGTPYLSQSRTGRQAGPQASVFHTESKPPGTGIGAEPYLAQFRVSKHTFIHGNNRAMFSTAQKNGFSSRKAKRNRFSGQQKRTKCTDTDTGQKHNTLVIKNLFPWHGFWTLQ